MRRVNLVINFDFPTTQESYLHRVGRAGRQQTKGIAISFVTTDKEKELTSQMETGNLKLNLQPLPDTLQK